MKHLRKYNEEILSKKIWYEREWVCARSEIRQKLEEDIKDISYEMLDYGYRYHTGGWIDDEPYVWIRHTETTRKRGKSVEENDINEYEARLSEYLEMNGFHITKIDKLSNQEFIYFDNPDLD